MSAFVYVSYEIEKRRVIRHGRSTRKAERLKCVCEWCTLVHTKETKVLHALATSSGKINLNDHAGFLGNAVWINLTMHGSSHNA